MSTILLIRHCVSTAQHPDAPLTDTGAAQAIALAEKLATIGVDAIYSSPYRRALATIEPFARQFNLVVQTDARLRERILSPEPLDDFIRHIQRSFEDPSHRAPGGESLAETRQRALEALKEISSRTHKLAVVVSHGNLIASVLKSANPDFGFEDWRALRNPDLFRLQFKNGLLLSYARLD